MSHRPERVPLHTIVLSNPAEEPVTTDELKSYLHLETEDDNALLSVLISAARLRLEAAMRQQMIAQSWQLLLNRWPRWGVLPTPLSPLRTILAVRVRDDVGDPTSLNPNDFLIDQTALSATILLPDFLPTPGRRAAGIEIDVSVGLSSNRAGLPQALKLATLELAASFYEHRAGARQETPVSENVLSLIRPYRRPKL